MSNLDFDPRHIPDPAEVIGRAQRSAFGSVVGSVDDNPDDVARAIDIANVTGVPASVVAGDLEHHEKKLKTNLSADLIRNNSYLLDYINSHPLAASLSGDDLGNLDKASQSMNRLQKGYLENTGDIVKHALDFFRTGPTQYKEVGAQTRAELLKQGTDPVQADAIVKNVEASAYRGEALQNILFLGYTLALSPALGAFRTYASHPIEESTGFPSDATEGLTMVALAGLGLKALANPRVAAGATGHIFPSGPGSSTGPKGVGSVRRTMEDSAVYFGESPEAIAGWSDQQLRDFLISKTSSVVKEAADVAETVKPYTAAGKEAPIGVHPVIDKANIEVSKAEVDALMDAVKESQTSLTKERNTDIYSDFVRQHVGDQNIGLYADALQALYGDKLPEVDDGILGFVPNLVDKIATAQATGGYVDIPMAEYIAKVEPEVAKALEDFTRVRQGGVSKGEAKDIKASVEVPDALPPERAVETVRDAAALVPKERKLELKRVEERQTPEGAVASGRDMGVSQASYHYEIQGPEGRVGDVWVAEERGGKRLYIDDIEGLNRGSAANTIGPRALRDLLEQLKAEFPNAEELMGYRVSGARDKAGSWETKGKVSIKLAEPTASDHLFQILLDDRIERLGEQSELGEGFKATTIPEARWQNFERSIVEKIDAEIEKLGIVDVDVEAIHKIENAKGELVRGLYQSYENARPAILVALTADDPVGVLRHEFMHDLRTRGLLDEAEWTMLEKGADTEGWIEKHDIKNRYPELNEEGWKEEAVADEYADWRRKGKPADTLYAKVFQKIDQLIEAIRAAMRQLFGTENWKDIFDKIESGEVAQREPTTEFGDVTKEAKGKEPPVPEGHVRFYHGSFKGAEPAKRGGKTWVTTDPVYARDFRSEGTPKEVSYIDLPKGDQMELAARAWDQLDEQGQTNMIGRYNAVELPEQYADQFKPLNPEAPTTSAKQPELPGTRRMEDRDVFAEAAAMGYTKEQYIRHMQLIAERHREDMRLEAERAMKDAKKRQSEKWKDDSAKMREQVVEEISKRPDIAADSLLREQRLFGRKTDPIKLGSGYLSEEQRAALPKDFVAKAGDNPDDIASLVGYESGQELVQGLINLDVQRKASGLRPIEFNRRLIAAETERQMEAKHGKLSENILEDAKEQVLSEVQLDLLSEDVLRDALRAGVEYSITKEQMKSWVQERFNGMEGKDVSSDKFLADAGRAGRMAFDASQKKDYIEAFRHSQNQYRAIYAARLAKDFEKKQEKFDTTIERYTSKEVSGASQEYTNAIHAMMISLGFPVRRSVQGIIDDMSKAGHDNFSEFVQAKTSALRDLHVPDWLRQGNNKRYKDLTVEERQELFKAMEALTFNSRDELKLTKAGEKFDLDQTLDKMIEQIKSLGEPREYQVDRAESKIEYAKSWWWAGINVESMLNRLDRDRSTGIFNQFIIRHFTEASNYKDKLIRDFQGKVAEIGKITDMDKLVDNPLFIDPITGEKFRFRRRNVLGILQQVGNANNLKILAEGYKVDPGMLIEWLGKNTTKEDWDRAQRIGDIFKDIYKLADNMSYNVSGVGIDALPLQPIETPFGTYEGWYNPIKHDPLRPGESKRLLGPDALEQEGFYRATTPQGYTKGRTGYIAPVELNLDIVPIRMRQMLHDIAMRPAVLQLSKIFYSPKFERAIIGYFGKHQAKEMIPFLHDIANSANFKSLSASYGESALEYFRQNTIATLIGLNIGTVMKHGSTAAVNSLAEVGPINFAREFFSLLSDTPEGDTNWRMAMDKSEELQRRMRNYTELISGHGSEINIKGARSKFGTYREFMMNVGATPVSISDLLSAVPTWLAQYKTSIARNADEGQAVYEADRAVRHAHGSSVLSNKPAIARTNALGAWFSSLYGFFSHMQQKQYELSWKAKDIFNDTVGKGSGDSESAKRHAPDLLKGLISYVIFPAIIEEMVTPYTNEERDSWGVKIAKGLALGIGASFIGVRDYLNALINFRDPQAGLAGTALKLAQDLPKDLLSRQPMSKDRAGKLLHHTFTTVGVLTGLTNNSEGNIAEYVWRYNHGLERPNGEWLKLLEGIRHGKTKPH